MDSLASLDFSSHTHDVSAYWNFWPFSWIVPWDQKLVDDFLGLPFVILFYPLQVFWNIIPNMVAGTYISVKLIIIFIASIPFLLFYVPITFGSAGFELGWTKVSASLTSSSSS